MSDEIPSDIEHHPNLFSWIIDCLTSGTIADLSDFGMDPVGRYRSLSEDLALCLQLNDDGVRQKFRIASYLDNSIGPFSRLSMTARLIPKSKESPTGIIHHFDKPKGPLFMFDLNGVLCHRYKVKRGDDYVELLFENTFLINAINILLNHGVHVGIWTSCHEANLDADLILMDVNYRDLTVKMSMRNAQSWKVDVVQTDR
jgi:hypothetical protein